VRFTSFLPAISKDALKKISAEIRSWRLHRRVNPDGREIAKLTNPKIRGWTGYYGAFCISKLYPGAPPHQHLPAAVGHEQLQEPEYLEESHQDAHGGRRETTAVLRALGPGQTGRQITRTARAVQRDTVTHGSGKARG
jgi:hypothetical protein